MLYIFLGSEMWKEWGQGIYLLTLQFCIGYSDDLPGGGIDKAWSGPFVSRLRRGS